MAITIVTTSVIAKMIHMIANPKVIMNPMITARMDAACDGDIGNIKSPRSTGLREERQVCRPPEDGLEEERVIELFHHNAGQQHVLPPQVLDLGHADERRKPEQGQQP